MSVREISLLGISALRFILNRMIVVHFDLKICFVMIRIRIRMRIRLVIIITITVTITIHCSTPLSPSCTRSFRHDTDMKRLKVLISGLFSQYIGQITQKVIYFITTDNMYRSKVSQKDVLILKTKSLAPRQPICHSINLIITRDA